jgi:hypothetical protein
MTESELKSPSIENPEKSNMFQAMRISFKYGRTNLNGWMRVFGGDDDYSGSKQIFDRVADLSTPIDKTTL